MLKQLSVFIVKQSMVEYGFCIYMSLVVSLLHYPTYMCPCLKHADRLVVVDVKSCNKCSS